MLGEHADDIFVIGMDAVLTTLFVRLQPGGQVGEQQA